MVTDEKRSEVAGSLRYFADYPGRPLQYMEQFINILREVIFSDVCSGADYSEMFQRLADLIDPESGQNLDTNRDSVPKESPAVPKAPECDREALLALADEMDAYSVHFSTGLQGCTVQAWAMGIREACGKAGA